jgi:hypothetical protein
MSKRLRPRLGLQATVTSACSVRREMENNLKRGRLGMRGVTSAVNRTSLATGIIQRGLVSLRLALWMGQQQSVDD